MRNKFIKILFFIFLASCIFIPASQIRGEAMTHKSHYLRNNHHNNTVIIFIHGVLGDTISTWKNDNGAYWPDLLKNDPDFKSVNIYLINYPSPLIERTYSINELAECIRRDMQSDKVLNHSKLIFLSHSMGGLVTREFLLKYKIYADKVNFLYFFATPTSGSPIAKLAKIISHNPQLGSMIPLKSDDSLANIQRNWFASEQMTKIPSYGAYEMKDTFGIRIVEQQSATHLCNRRVDPIDKNHLDIVKPADIYDESYRAFKSAYLDASKATHSSSIEDKKKEERLLSEVRKTIKKELSSIERPPESKRLEKIAQKLGVSVEDILTRLEKGTMLEQGQGALLEQNYDLAIQLLTSNAKLNETDACQSWFLVGNAFYFKSNFPKADEAYKKAAELNPNDAKVWNNWGASLFNQKKYDEGIVKSKNALEIEPSFAEAWVNWGAALAQLKKYDEAIDKFKEALKYDPDEGTVWKNWGHALMDLKKNEEARDKFEVAIKKYRLMIKKDPKDQETYLLCGTVLALIEKYYDSIDMFKAAIEIKPNYSDAWNNWGTSLAKLGKYEDAIPKFEKAVEYRPDNAEAWNNWALALIKLSRDKEALEKYEKAVTYKRDYYEAWSRWGDTLVALEKYDDAILKYKEALKDTTDHSPMWQHALMSWGVSLVKLDKNEEGIEKFKEVIKFKPDDSDTLRNWGSALLNLGKDAEAIQKFQEAVKYNQDYAEAWYDLGHTLLKLNKNEDAIKAIEEAIKSRQNYPEAWVIWGNALLNIDKKSEAMKKYNEAINYKPDFAMAWVNWGTVLVMIEEYENAIEKFKESLKYEPKNYNALYNWGIALMKLGKESEAKFKFMEADKIK